MQDSPIEPIDYLTITIQTTGYPQQDPTPLLSNNQAAIQLASNLEFPKKTQHIDMAFRIIREQWGKRELLIVYVPSNSQLADIYTKLLPSDKIQTIPRYARNNPMTLKVGKRM
jgi:hypothetical protein